MEGDIFKCDDLSEEHHKIKKETIWKLGAYEYTGCLGCLLKEKDIIAQLNFYNDYRIMGLPFPDLGWGSSPAWMVDIIRALEQERMIIQKEKE